MNEHFAKEMNVTLQITENTFNIPLGKLFQLAARKNPKRHFLFASALIGKYISVRPELPLITSMLLAHLFLKAIGKESSLNSNILSASIKDPHLLKTAIKERDKKKADLDQPTLFIGFAETATGIGHGVFDSVGSNASFIHTTRQKYDHLEPTFQFNEEHSHATDHFCYDPKDLIRLSERVVLIDDEVTTGKTCLNLIRTIQKQTPKKEFFILTILDWRKEEERQHFNHLEEELGIRIHVLTLLRGQLNYEETAIKPQIIFKETKRVDHLTESRVFSIQDKALSSHWPKEIPLSGRFGFDHTEKAKIDVLTTQIAHHLKPLRLYENTLCLGHGEFIYIPNLISLKMGTGISFHSTARSPIHVIDRWDYPIRDTIQIYDKQQHTHFNLYNIFDTKYKEVFLFLDRPLDQEAVDQLTLDLSKRGIRNLHFIHFF